MHQGLTTSFSILLCLPACGLVSGSGAKEPQPDPVSTYEAFGRSLDPVAASPARDNPSKKSSKKTDTKGGSEALGRLDPVRRKTWLEEEKEALALAKANGSQDILGRDRVSRLARGMALYKERKLEGARETCLKLLGEDPVWFPARRQLAETSLSLNEWEAARDAFEIVRTQLGPGPRTDTDLGRVLLLKIEKERKRGRELLAKHVADPKYGVGNVEQIVMYDFGVQRPERAEPLIVEASKAHPDPAETRRLRLLLAMSWYRQAKWKQAGPLLVDLAHEQWAGQGRALVTLFQLQRALGLFEDAQKTLELLATPQFAQARRVLVSSEDQLQTLTRQLAAEKRAGHRLRPILVPEIVTDLIYQPVAAKRRQTLMQISRMGLKSQARFFELSLTREKDPEIRKLAYLLLARSYPQSRAFLELGMKDSDPIVRKAAIEKLADLPDKKEAQQALFRALEREQDPEIFRKLHSALCDCCGEVVFLEPSEEASKKGREARRKYWSEKLDILRSSNVEGDYIERGKKQK